LKAARLICIVGPDGVGKTTQARLLEKTYRGRGIPATYVWMRFHHVFSLPLLALARLLGLTEVQHLTSGGTASNHHFNRVRPVAIAYAGLLLLDTMVATGVKVCLRLAMGKTVICDRFTYDTLVDLMISTEKRDVANSFVTRCFLLLATRAIAVIIMATPQALRLRREDIREDRYLDWKIELYSILSKKCEIPVIYSDGSVQQVHLAIIRAVDEVMARG